MKITDFLIAVLLSTLVLYPVTAAAEPELAQLVNERLGYMKAVAAYKWINQRAIEDIPREHAVLSSAARAGLDHNLTVDSSTRFFRVQIKAAKEIQSYWFKEWQKGSAPTEAPDLILTVRPALLSLGNHISAELGQQKISSDSIQAEGLTRDTAEELAAAANQINFYPNVLARVTHSGLLRVGTTGDYEPFSYESAHSEKLVGIDIDLALDLAGSLGVELELVETSWPTLMADFQKGFFDIGMSGISINLARAQLAFFSDPYHTGGKAAIGRCEDIPKLNTLDKIDQPGVSLVVNPGGTNQKFVDGHIKQAGVTVHPDNRTIFQEIIKAKADVMITDAIEVKVKSNRYPELCSTLGDQTLSFQSKGYLLPQDSAWKHFVDTWLAQRRGDKTLKATFIRHQAD